MYVFLLKIWNGSQKLQPCKGWLDFLDTFIFILRTYELRCAMEHDVHNSPWLLRCAA